MKSDTERKHFHKEKKHKRKKRLNAHLSKDLRGKLKSKRRSLLVRKDDRVKVMRGPGKGKEGRVTRVSVVKRKIYVDGVVVTNAKGREIPIALQPSNLLLLSLEPTELRKKLFSEGAFKKAKKTEKKTAEKQDKPEKVEAKPAVAEFEKQSSKPKPDVNATPAKPEEKK